MKHVLCEKPFAMSVVHAREMVAACRDAGVILRIAHQLRLEAAIVRVREMVRAGRLGRLVAISLERASGLGARTSWRQDFSQSGVVFDVGVICRLVQWVSGQPFVEVVPDPDRGEANQTTR
jgi:1,5-anhydro-D-fructose reductase (1,5-anhydro-D-mannitol-forming)